MKKINCMISALMILGVFVACGNKNKPKKLEEPLPLNISVFLDLSDRLTRDLSPSQISRDTAIIGYVTDWLKEKTVGAKILQSKNRMKILFYPAPKSSDIATLASELYFDVAKFKGVEKRKALEGYPSDGTESLKSKFQKNLAAIYDKTVDEKDWVGCDIWDFFSSKKVDAQCVENGFRNILIILTDGYLYEANHKEVDGHAYSYISPKTLSDSTSSLIVKRDVLNDLEVAVLEINPYDIKHRDKMKEVLESWLQAMGVAEEHVTVAETDLPVHVKTIVRSFLEK